MKLRTLALSSTVLTVTLVLAGCATSPGGMGMDHTSPTSSSDASTAGVNEADIAFATAMIAHHQQAIEMADRSLTRFPGRFRCVDHAALAAVV